MFSFDPIYSRKPSRSFFNSFIENFKFKTNNKVEQSLESPIHYKTDTKTNFVEIMQQRHSIHSIEDYRGNTSKSSSFFRKYNQYSKSTVDLTSNNRKTLANEIGFSREFKDLTPLCSQKSPYRESNFVSLQNVSSSKLDQDPMTNQEVSNKKIKILKETDEIPLLNIKSNISLDNWKPYAKNSSRILYKGRTEKTPVKLDSNLIQKRKELVVNPIGIVLYNFPLQNSTERIIWDKSSVNRTDSLTKYSLDKVAKIGKSVFKAVTKLMEQTVENMFSSIDKFSKGKIGVDDAIRIFIRLSKIFGLKSNEINIKNFFGQLYIDNEYKLNLNQFKKNLMSLFF